MIVPRLSKRYCDSYSQWHGTYAENLKLEEAGLIILGKTNMSVSPGFYLHDIY